MLHHGEENQTAAPQTAEQLKSCIKQEWAKNPLAELLQLGCICPNFWSLSMASVSTIWERARPCSPHGRTRVYKDML